MPLPFILAHIAARTGLAMWRHRLAWLGATLLIAALGLYQMTFAGPSVTNGDCADTAMAAVTRADDAAAHAAYACLGPGLRNTSEDQFVANLHQRDSARGQVNRVAEQRQMLDEQRLQARSDLGIVHRMDASKLACQAVGVEKHPLALRRRILIVRTA